MVEELMIVAKEVEGGLTGFGVPGPPGTGNSRFSMETGQDFRDCDVIGEEEHCCLQSLSSTGRLGRTSSGSHHLSV